MKLESVRLPTFSSGVFQVWKRNYYQFKRSWLMNFFWIMLEPLLFLVAIGYGLGSFISDMNGFSYVEFFFPALLCITSMLVAFFEATYGSFAKLTHQGTYATMVLTALEPKQIVVGEIFWAATKGTISSLAVALVAGVFGHLQSWMILPALAVIFISSFVFAAFGMLVTSLIKSYDGIIYPTSGLIVPMSLFCGTYFPISHLSYGLQYLVYLFPLTHTVELVRGLMLSGIVWWHLLLHLGFLIIVGAIFMSLANKRITKRLLS